MPGNSEGRPGEKAATTNAIDSDAKVTRAADIAEYPTRRPCRTPACSGTRPLVDIGSSYLWDRCARCARRSLLGQPARSLGYPNGRLNDLDPWHERIVELLELAEAGTR